MQGRNALVGALVGVGGVWAIGGVSTASAAGAPPRYRAEPIWVPTFFQPTAMNASRVIAGWTYDEHGRSQQAATVADGVLTQLGFGGGTQSVLSDINDAGVGVGTWWTDDDYSNRGFVWRSGGALEPLPRYDMPGSASSASAINRHGQIAGAVWGGNMPFAARWDAPDVPATLLAQLSWSGSEARDINDSAESIGADRWGDNPRVWRADGSFELLPEGEGEVSPLGINNAGEIVASVDNGTVAFWGGVGELTIVAAGWHDLTIVGLDDAGRVIWAGDSPDADPMEHVWVWDRGVTYVIDDLIDGFDGRVGYALVMNSGGEILASTSRGWQILTPIPSPGAAISLAVLAGVCAGRRARRGLTGGGS